MAVPVGDGRGLVYGPRLGRLYLLPLERIEERGLQSALGLGRYERSDCVADPVREISCTEVSLHGRSLPPPASAAVRAYRFLHWSRGFIPLARMARVLGGGLGRPGSGQVTGPQSIGEMLCAIERAVSLSDCYPRALVSAWLAAQARLPCQLTLGVLSPTRKMHLWCTVDAVLPYEPKAEHYLYTPLFALSLLPQ
ncbi:lasso peptide biosynthesis protein [Dactylosporangium sp. CA-092794]|uniref:lasso peptide biosynthesis protein n=1 Tax=Dactylosporangium sp. CA-092794 TaxID=3239929 RepID=UPI003D901143